MKVKVIQSTDGFDKPNGTVIEDIVINEQVTTTGVTLGEFAEVTLNNGAVVWLKADVLKPIDPAARVAADRASIVV